MTGHRSERGPLTQREEEYVGEHIWIAGQDFASGVWQSECSCGWAWGFEGLDTEEDALDRWENHCDAVFMEATGG